MSEMTSGLVERLRDWTPEFDDRVGPLLLAEAARRDATMWNYEDAENVIAFLLSPSRAPLPAPPAKDTIV